MVKDDGKRPGFPAVPTEIHFEEIYIDIDKAPL